MSKGDWRRKAQVPMREVDSNWDRIFGKKQKTEEEKFDEQVIMKNEYYDFTESDYQSNLPE